MELSAEAILEELNEFEKGDQEVTPVLNEYLQKIAKTGNILHPWSKLKPLLKRKMEMVLADFCKSCPPDSIPSYPNTDKFEYDRLKTSILEAVDYFPNAPFTIQRLCELITDPRKHYNRTDKYMRGLEKNLLVVSTIGRNENDGSAERDLSASNDWANSDSSSEGHSYADAATNVSVAAPAVNGTVLENFATVFPSATRIPNKANNIQVAIVTDTSAYQNLESVDNLEYEVIDNSDIEREMRSSEEHEDDTKPEEPEPASELKECEEFYNSGDGSNDSEKQEVSSISSEGEECNEEKPTDVEEQDQPSKHAIVEEESNADISTNEAEKAADEDESPAVAETAETESEMNIDKSDVSSTSDTVEKIGEEETTLCEEESSSESSEIVKETETDNNADEPITEPTAKRRKYEDSEQPDENQTLDTEPINTAFLSSGDSNQPSTPDISQPQESESVADKPTSTTE